MSERRGIHAESEKNVAYDWLSVGLASSPPLRKIGAKRRKERKRGGNIVKASSQVETISHSVFKAGTWAGPALCVMLAAYPLAFCWEIFWGDKNNRPIF